MSGGVRLTQRGEPSEAQRGRPADAATRSRAAAHLCPAASHRAHDVLHLTSLRAAGGGERGGVLLYSFRLRGCGNAGSAEPPPGPSAPHAASPRGGGALSPPQTAGPTLSRWLSGLAAPRTQPWSWCVWGGTGRRQGGGEWSEWARSAACLRAGGACTTQRARTRGRSLLLLLLMLSHGHHACVWVCVCNRGVPAASNSGERPARRQAGAAAPPTDPAPNSAPPPCGSHFFSEQRHSGRPASSAGGGARAAHCSAPLGYQVISMILL